MSGSNGAPRGPELWGGVECTVNRVQDRFFDQCQRSGHWARLEDLQRFAKLGIKALRYPLLWEIIAPEAPGPGCWALPDERLARLRDLDIRPIVGLVHHGSGPRHTNLLDPRFPAGLAAFARSVAERYPWVTDFTPVNEPLTTARFSGLYGHWYPHGKDDLTFIRALLIQCRAVVESMRAIREVIPQARLIQTEDMGRTYCTAPLVYQAEFDNARRWLSLDLLCGGVDRHHPLWKWLLARGAQEEELAFFLHNPAPPQIIGLNYYLTSDRLLDHRMENHPPWSHGGNGRDAYADVAAVRALPGGITGHRAILRATWERYRLPVALSEVHLGCTREEQMRWLLEAWEGARGALAEGVDVRALTVWSLLGAFDWNALVTEMGNFYEPGAFDVRAPRPRPTALAKMVRELAEHGRADHPVLDSPGWWRRPLRLAPVHRRATVGGETVTDANDRRARPLLIAGATGTLGRALARLCHLRGLEYRLLSRAQMDIAEPDSVQSALEHHRPWAVINAAGFVRVDDAELDSTTCFRENSRGPAVLAALCQSRGLKLVTFSSDLVFDGARDAPYPESHPVRPLNVYGQSKAEAETLVLERMPRALVVRTGAFFGPWDEHNFIAHALSAVLRGETFFAADDVVVSPTYVPDLVHATLDLLIDGEEGIWHLTNGQAVTWHGLARRAAELAELNAERIRGCPLEMFRWRAARPHYSALGSERGQLLPSLEDALRRFIDEREHPIIESASLGGGGLARKEQASAGLQ